MHNRQRQERHHRQILQKAPAAGNHKIPKDVGHLDPPSSVLGIY